VFSWCCVGHPLQFVAVAVERDPLATVAGALRVVKLENGEEVCASRIVKDVDGSAFGAAGVDYDVASRGFHGVWFLESVHRFVSVSSGDSGF